MDRIKRHTKRVTIGIVGGVVVLVGIIMIPYPGPGWLVVFAGLAVLATEFDDARRILETVRRRYDQWTYWVKRQSRWVQLGIVAVTAAVVIVTVWLVNGYGFMNQFLQLQQPWLISPFFR